MRKTLALLFAICLAALLVVNVSATEVETAPEVVVPTNVEVIVTNDSAGGTEHSILWDTTYDLSTNTAYVVLNPDLGAGYTVYDVSDTDYIDGIRVNGDYVYSYRIPVTTAGNMVIEVKVGYTKDILGDIAQMYDGTYDYAQLFSNPVLFLQGVYYVLAILFLVATVVLAFFGKGKTAKTSNEIADSVEAKLTANAETMKTDVVNVVMTEAKEVLGNILAEMQNVVTAVTVSMFKSKDAPLTALDILGSIKNLTASDIIDKVRESVEKNLDEEASNKELKKDTLHQIATGSTPDSVIDPKEPEPVETSESIF